MLLQVDIVSRFTRVEFLSSFLLENLPLEGPLFAEPAWVYPMASFEQIFCFVRIRKGIPLFCTNTTASLFSKLLRCPQTHRSDDFTQGTDHGVEQLAGCHSDNNILFGSQLLSFAMFEPQQHFVYEANFAGSPGVISWAFRPIK